MDALEARATTAENRLAALEDKLAGGGPPAAHSSTMDVERYVTELHALREVLVAAQAEAEAKDAQIQSLETANSKLAYQIAHLKKAVKENDEKLAKLSSPSDS